MNMQPQMTQQLRWIEMDGDSGLQYVPFDEVCPTQNQKTMNPSRWNVGLYYDGLHCHSAQIVDGYGVRMSADGFLDCTSWEVFTSEEQAIWKRQSCDSR